MDTNSSAFSKLISACFIIGLLNGCEFYHGKDYIAEGFAQEELSQIISSIALIERTDASKIVHLYSNTGKSPSYWFKINFDPDNAQGIQQMLKSKGYISTRSGNFVPMEPPNDLIWWRPNTFDPKAQMILKGKDARGSYDRAWCILDMKKGEMLGWATSP